MTDSPPPPSGAAPHLMLVQPEHLPLAPRPPRIPAKPDLTIDSLRAWNEAVTRGEGDLVGALVTDLAGAEADMHRGHVGTTTIRGGSLADACFDDASLHDVDLHGVDLAGASFRGATFERVRLEQCRLVGTRLMEARLRDVVLVDCTLELANLRLAQLERVSIAGCHLRQADLQGVRGTSVRLTSCDLAGATFHRAEFVRSRVVDCSVEELAGVDGLKGCTIDLIDAVELAPRLAGALGITVLPPGATDEPG